MAHHQHNHHHQHDDQPAQRRFAEELDPASRSLAEALRVSFRLLSVAMLLLVVAYVFSGMTCVPSGEQVVISRFGQLVVDRDKDGVVVGGVHGPGLRFSWPYPVDRVIHIPTINQLTKINTFWFREMPGSELKPLSQMAASGETLEPGYDGALITGDQGLVHVKWVVEYVIPRADTATHTEQVIQFARNVTTMPEAERVVRTAVENASVSVAAQYGVEEIYTSATGEFIADVQRAAQKNLDGFQAGIEIASLTIPENGKTVPLQALSAFNRVTEAVQRRDAAVSEANKNAKERLINAGGAEYLRIQRAVSQYDQAQRQADRLAEAALADLPTGAVGAYQEALRQILDVAQAYGEKLFLEVEAERDESGQLVRALQNDLLPAYARALVLAPEAASAARLAILHTVPPERTAAYEPTLRAFEREAADLREPLDRARQALLAAGADAEALAAYGTAAYEAGALYARVGELLVSRQTAGEAATRISQARSYAEEVKRKADMQWVRFDQLRREYEKNPDLLVSWLWMQTKQDILSSKTVIKEYTTPNGPKVVFLNVDPRITEAIQRQRYQATQEQVRRQREGQ